MSAFRAGLTQFVTTARGELRLAMADAPVQARRALIAAAWGAIAILLGSLIGVMAVILPPTGVFGLVLASALVLLWVLPDIEVASVKLLRRMLYVALVVNLAIPIYYTVQIGSLPWVSARRIVTFPLVAIFALAFSSSREVRQRISLVFRHNRLLAVLVLGYLVSAVLSLFTAVNPIASLNEVVLAVFEWYSFFMICVYVFRSEKDIDLFVRIVMWCAVVISLVGLGDFIFHKHLYLDILPKPMINSLLESNPAVQQMLDAFNASRSGMIRETSVFNTAIPFSEFEAMIAMLAVVFFLDGRRWTDRLFGVIIFILCFFGIFVSGSRSGYVALLGAGAAFTIATFLRALRQEWGSIRPALLGVTSVAGFVMLIGAVIVVPGVHNRVLGGGAAQASNEGRHVEWQLATPKILSNPVTGHGFGWGGPVVGYAPCDTCMETIDSYAISALVETGVLGYVTFFGSVVFASWFAFRRYVLDPSWTGALAGGLGSCFIAHLIALQVCSQRETFMLMYSMTACVMILNILPLKEEENEPASRPVATSRRGAV